MGCCCVKDSTTSAIDTRIGDDFKREQSIQKLLFLGTGSSGKSTLLKSLKEVNDDEIMDDSTLTETLNMMRHNVLQMMKTLCEKSAFLSEEFSDCIIDTDDELVQEAVRLIVHYAQHSARSIAEATENEAYGRAVDYMWRLAGIQATYHLSGGRFFMEENIDFFFDKSTEFFKDDYVVTREDVIKTRVRTTGAIQYQYEQDKCMFEVIDVGGQRSERKKWVHQFSDVSAVVFVTALNHYRVALFEEENENAMHDAIRQFDEITNNSTNFRDTEIILFMNKEDLFRKMLSDGESLSLCFSREAGWPEPYECWNDEQTPWSAGFNDEEFETYYQQALFFVQDRYMERNRTVKRNILTHVMCATQSEGMERIFWDVQNIVIRANLEQGGMLVGDPSGRGKYDPEDEDAPMTTYDRPKILQRGYGEIEDVPLV
jgi:GTPase SAR1 family protein